MRQMYTRLPSPAWMRLQLLLHLQVEFALQKRCILPMNYVMQKRTARLQPWCKTTRNYDLQP